MKDIIEIHRQFMRNYHGSIEEDQRDLRIKGWGVAFNGLLAVLMVIVLYATVSRYCAENGFSPLITPTAFAVAMLLFYKGFAFMCRKALEE